MRYVERNALAAGLVQCAEDWRFGGLFNWLGRQSGITLAKLPVPRIPNRVQRVNRAVSAKDEEQLKRCIARVQRVRATGWVESIARQYNLESTLRKRG